LAASLHAALNHLTRAAVFVEHATTGESLAVDENVSFETELRLLADDNETGLYWLMCVLHRAIHIAGVDLEHRGSRSRDGGV